MSMHRGPLPEPKRPMEWKTALLLIGASVLGVLFWGFVVWVTGLYAFLKSVLTKDVLGLIAAVGVSLIFLAVFAVHDRRRGSGHED